MSSSVINNDMQNDLLKDSLNNDTIGAYENSVWSIGIFSTIVFCFIGVLPAFVIKNEKDFKNSFVFKCLLGFAAGSLFADIMLHLLPEAFRGDINNGKYIIVSFLLFLIIEKLADLLPERYAIYLRPSTLNLIANCFDNSAHGTTVVGAFGISKLFGFIALTATLIHEVPHEFADFALLLRDGYSREKAIMAQIVTASIGSACATMMYASDLSSAHHTHGGSFMLPFTIGGFLYISLVGIIPEIVEEEDRKTFIAQLISVFVGILFIYLIVSLEEAYSLSL